ncbi:putative cytochrome p450 [Lyophyllum shimeji]|uniref:Cytochrome p450 n=1 Tax=Lyophyllum shimeji TaxID=47721 RepID=A0A9P3UMP1_LYOSH|nr:putative cytochrome p450 [Lyophyllum shimeji]
MLEKVISNLTIFCLGSVLASLLRSIVQFVKARVVLRHIPGPPPSSSLWGEEWVLYHSLPGSPYLRWHRQYGKVVRFSGAFGHQILSITDPRAISFIIGEGIYSFPKPNGVRAWFKATLGEGILWVEGKAAHEKQRRTLAPALSQHSWTKLLDKSHAEEIEIEVTNWAGRFALDTIARAAFSYNFDCLSDEPHALAEALDGLTNNENKLSSFYMRALFWIFPPILSIGKKGEMIRRAKQELGAIASKMWKDAKVAGDSEGRTLMALMLKADEAAGQCMNEEQIVSQMRTTISAGYETVSALIAWLLYELSRNPELQSDVREEVSTATDPTFDELNNKFPLLDAVLKETLRLHPAVLENHHEAGDTIVVPLSEPLPGTTETHLVIPKGTTIAIPLNVVHTDAEVWGPDADEFRPQRWIERKQAGIRGARELLAFSEGPRSCIGKAFALAEIKALTVTLLRHFAFSCPYEIEAFQSFVIRPRIKGQGPSSLPLLVRKL